MRIKNSIGDAIVSSWYQSRYRWWTFLLLPLSLVFALVVTIRRFLYRVQILHVESFSVPVIVVGNITVGGTGKTPLVIYLVEQLTQAGFRPGVVSRGYGGDYQDVSWVKPESLPSEVGDEPCLIARRTAVPFVVCRKRTRAIKALLQGSDCNVVVSDDGLQHYAMGRDIEITVIDGKRALGNRLCLPAGPLRELPSRLKHCDITVSNGQSIQAMSYAMHLENQEICSDKKRFNEDASSIPVHAVAGIGNPQRFFDALRALGFKVIEHAFADHHHYAPLDLQFEDNHPIIMTEKDWVKCRPFAQPNWYYLPISAKLSDEFLQALLQRLSEKKL